MVTGSKHQKGRPIEHTTHIVYCNIYNYNKKIKIKIKIKIVLQATAIDVQNRPLGGMYVSQIYILRKKY